MSAPNIRAEVERIIQSMIDGNFMIALVRAQHLRRALGEAPK